MWTCSRSKRGTPQSRREASIWSGPRAPEEIQTLSAENRLDGPSSLARPYPITFWDEPYIGEELIMRPPASKKARMTSRAGIARDRVVADIEGDPAAEPDHRQRFAARGDRLGEDAALLGRRDPRPQQRGRAGRRQGAQQAAAVQ